MPSVRGGSIRSSPVSSASTRAWFDTSLAGSEVLAEAGDDLVTGWLLGFGCHLARRTTTAVDVGLPTLNEFRRTESRRALAGAERRLGS